MDSYRAIENLMYSYAERIDQGDFEGVAELFRHADMGAPAIDHRIHGYDEVLEQYRSTTRLYENGTPCTQHVISNVAIEVDEAANTATARSRYTVFQSLPDFPLQPVIAGRYEDRFERVDGGWRFSERMMFTDLFGDLSRHLLINLDES